MAAATLTKNGKQNESQVVNQHEFMIFTFCNVGQGRLDLRMLVQRASQIFMAILILLALFGTFLAVNNSL